MGEGEKMGSEGGAPPAFENPKGGPAKMLCLNGQLSTIKKWGFNKVQS